MKGRTMRHTVLLAALPLILAGCVSLGGGKPPPTLFSLTADHAAPAGSEATGKLADALVIEDPATDLRLSVLRVPVQVDAANVAYLQNAQWVERPSRQFGTLLAETIRARGKRLVFSAREAGTGGAVRLSGRLLDMGYDAQSQSVVIRYDAIRNSGGDVATKRFESVVPGIGPQPAAIGPALNRAANQIASQVADWVG
jgi:cholesterol transport system auxiliary component